MKTIEVKTYTNVDGAHYFGGVHVVENEIAAKLIGGGAEELKAPKDEAKESPQAAEPKTKSS